MKKTGLYLYVLLLPYAILLAAALVRQIVRYAKAILASTFIDRLMVFRLYGEPMLFIITGVLLGCLVVCVMRQPDHTIYRMLLVNSIVLVAFYGLVWVNVDWFYTTTEWYPYSGVCLGVYGFLAAVTGRRLKGREKGEK